MTRLFISAAGALMISAGIFAGLGELVTSSEQPCVGPGCFDIGLRVLHPTEPMTSGERATEMRSPESIREAALDDIMIEPTFSSFLIGESLQWIEPSPTSPLMPDPVELEPFMVELDQI